MFNLKEKVIGARADDSSSDHHGNDHDHHAHGNDHHAHGDDHHHFDRCKELVFDAAIENKEGVHYFFKGE